VEGFYIPPRAKTLEELLRFTTVEHLLASHGNIHSVFDTDTVETTLRSFKDNNVQSVPVYSSADKLKFLGMVDTVDILAYMLSLGVDKLGPGFFQTEIGGLVGLSKFSPTPTVPLGTSLIEVLKILQKGESHRVGVVDPATKSLYNIISQMSLIQFISRNISLMGENLRNKPVHKFMKQIVQVHNVPFDAKTLSAFEYLFKGNISAAAVVDAAGQVLDTLSTFDIVGFLNDEQFELANRIVFKFLYSTRRTKAVKPPIVCDLNDTLEYVLLKLASTRVHRLWVVGESNKYLGLVNLTNVLHAVAFELLETAE